MFLFLLTPLREGRRRSAGRSRSRTKFLLTPLREGRQPMQLFRNSDLPFLLTPLREGRPWPRAMPYKAFSFLLTPLREGRHAKDWIWTRRSSYFYSRPCGRGDRQRLGRSLMNL